MCQTMKLRQIRTFILLIAFTGLSLPASGQNASHTVSVNVSTITLLQVSSGTVGLTITGAFAVAGQDLMTAADQGTSLLWGVNSSNKKVTVRTSLAAPIFTLKVEAVSPTQGLAAGQVTLSTTDNDFLLNIGRSSGTCTLRFTGEALASQGTGTDSHTVTFTIVSE